MKFSIIGLLLAVCLCHVYGQSPPPSTTPDSPPPTPGPSTTGGPPSTSTVSGGSSSPNTPAPTPGPSSPGGSSSSSAKIAFGSSTSPVTPPPTPGPSTSPAAPLGGSSSVKPASGVSSTPPGPPPSGSSTNSMNILPPLANVDTEIQMVFKQFLPSFTPDQIAVFAKNKSVLFSLFDMIPDISWSMQPQLTNVYSQYLERLFVNNNKDVSIDRIKKFIPFRTDCNLDPIIKASNFTPTQKDNFIKETLMKLPPQIGGQLCGNLVSSLSTNNQPPTVNNLQSTINSGIPIGALFQQNQLNFLPPDDKVKVLGSLTNASTKVDKQTAQSLANNIPKGTPISDVASVSSSLPIEILNNASSAQLKSAYGKMDFDNMDQGRINFLANKMSSSATASDISDVLKNGNAKLAGAIPFKKILELNVSTDSIPVSNLPPALILNDAKSLLDTKTVDQISDTRSLVKISKGITPSDIKKIPKNSEIKAAISLLNASNSDSSPSPLTKTQRTALRDSVLNSLKTLSGKSDPADYLSFMSSSDAANLAELFVEANDNILAALSKNSALFTTVISALAAVPSTRCNSFLKKGATLYTSYAIKNLKGSSKISASNLDSLGICFANNIPNSDLSDLSSDDLVSKISYFSGDNFQPDQQTATTFGAKITEAINSKSTQSDKEDLIFNELKDTAIFASNLDTAISSTTMASKGKSLVSQAVDSKDTTDSTVKINRLGVGDDSYIAGKLSTLKKKYAKDYLSSLSTSTVSGRKKRSVVSGSVSCQNLYDLSGSLDALDATDLSKISNFSACLTFYNTYTWSSSQATALAALAKPFYSNNVASIPDTDIGYLSTILPAFSTDELKTLKISSLNTINQLGKVSTWSNDQLTSLSSAIKSNFGAISQDALSQMKNIACGLGSSDWSSVTSGTLTNALPTLKTIDNADCPGIPTMFNKFKEVYGQSIFDTTNLVDLGVIGGGFDASQISSISSDQLSFIDLSYIPASTVNSFPTSYLQSLTTSQISQLSSSPYYSSFSKDVTSTLTSLASNTQTTTTSNSNNIKFNLICLILALVSALLFQF